MRIYNNLGLKWCISFKHLSIGWHRKNYTITAGPDKGKKGPKIESHWRISSGILWDEKFASLELGKLWIYIHWKKAKRYIVAISKQKGWNYYNIPCFIGQKTFKSRWIATLVFRRWQRWNSRHYSIQHRLDHESEFPIAVYLATITYDGVADIFRSVKELKRTVKKASCATEEFAEVIKKLDKLKEHGEFDSGAEEGR